MTFLQLVVVPVGEQLDADAKVRPPGCGILLPLTELYSSLA